MRRVLGWGCLVLVILVVLHPWLLGLPGRMASARLKSGLRVGMSEAQVKQLEETIEAPPSENSARWGNTFQSYEDVMRGRGDYYRMLDYATWGTLCIDTGDRYTIYFDRSHRLSSWIVKPYTDSC